MKKIRASETRYTDVDVLPRDIYVAFLDHFASKAFPDPKLGPLPDASRDSMYINKEGHWEHWEDGHGSGYTTTYRAATDEEKALMETYQKLRDMRNLF